MFTTAFAKFLPRAEVFLSILSFDHTIFFFFSSSPHLRMVLDSGMLESSSKSVEVRRGGNRTKRLFFRKIDSSIFNYFYRFRILLAFSLHFVITWKQNEAQRRRIPKEKAVMTLPRVIPAALRVRPKKSKAIPMTESAATLLTRQILCP